MDIEYEGKTYPYDMDGLDIDQALAIEKHIDGPMLDYETGMQYGRALCVQALGWLILAGGDLDVPIASVKFKYRLLMSAFSAAAEKEAAGEKAEEQAGPGPTGSGHAAASTGRKSARASSPSA